MSPPSAQERRVSDSPSLTPIPVIPPVQETNPPDPPDPNMANPRLIFNRALIYERRLPGDAYITAHVQRLQHGYYSSEIVSDKGAKHVDFLAIAFTFHSPHTITHRIKSATIKVSVHGSRELPSSKRYPYGTPPGNPHFFMHAPHLLYGTVSPETMEWTFSLAGSLGISEMPVSASVIPSGSVNSRYKRYEMMRVQGSARTLKSATDPKYNVEAGQIVWSMEENNVQQSGLPREFTFVMLVQKPSARSRVTLSIDVDPVIDAMLGSYPALMLKLPEYLPLSHRGVDFQQEVGQRFEPVDPVRGFNFANLGSMFDEYIAMPGRKYSRQMQIPADNGTTENHFQVPFPGQFGPFNPNPYQQQLQTNNLALQNNGLSLQNNLLQTTLQSLGTGHREDDPQPRAEPRAYHGPSNTAMADQPPPPSPSTSITCLTQLWSRNSPTSHGQAQATSTRAPVALQVYVAAGRRTFPARGCQAMHQRALSQVQPPRVPRPERADFQRLRSTMILKRGDCLEVRKCFYTHPRLDVLRGMDGTVLLRLRRHRLAAPVTIPLLVHEE
ncbi:hypothetical protein N7457_006653 [Penicillium paradoxum]|uniref:uncharacterized protein n=1 Tax=Penicillium paradoxum TaxID=176176 RepID=UPI0025471426|nr:uncharacterized protein N7457_006653 [Penicillium paradoxum]KAJ5778933.1 hypothetical protein N7457_006653 [Penicillium paradoxum]